MDQIALRLEVLRVGVRRQVKVFRKTVLGVRGSGANRGTI